MTLLRALAGVIALWLSIAPALAEGCGGEISCEIGGGSYHARVPEGPARGAVLFLHGWGGTSVATIENAGLVAPLLARGYAVVAPQGLPRRPGEAGGRWNSLATADGRDDVAFVRSVAADAADRFGFPPGEVLAAGFSGGGMMIWRIACDAPDAFAAYAPVSGLLWRPLPATCAGPVRLHHTHGWADPVVPLEGRSVGGGQLTQGDLFAGLDLLRRAGGCGRHDPDATGGADGFLWRGWTDCAAGAELVFALHPGGHRVPAGWGDLVLDWFESGTGDGSG